MDLRQEFENAHIEHEEILEFLNDWEDALRLIADDDCDTRCHGLRQLQAMESKSSTFASIAAAKRKIRDRRSFCLPKRRTAGV
jgi:hypothetical protein